MADKYDRFAAVLSRQAEPDANGDAQYLASIVADSLRALEQAASDIDRIATALERIAEKLQ